MGRLFVFLIIFLPCNLLARKKLPSDEFCFIRGRIRSVERSDWTNHAQNNRVHERYLIFLDIVESRISSKSESEKTMGRCGGLTSQTVFTLWGKNLNKKTGQKLEIGDVIEYEEGQPEQIPLNSYKGVKFLKKNSSLRTSKYTEKLYDTWKKCKEEKECILVPALPPCYCGVDSVNKAHEDAYLEGLKKLRGLWSKKESPSCEPCGYREDIKYRSVCSLKCHVVPSF